MFMDLQGPWNPLLGRLPMLLNLKYTNPFIAAAFAMVVIGGIVVVVALTYYRRWGWLWREWLTTVDHKKIGIMYLIVGLVMLFRGFFDAFMIRTHQAIAVGASSPGFLSADHGYLPPFHFDEVFTAHGTIMILLAVTPMLVGFMNLIVPIQIGARDMAYPFLNAVGLWLTAVAAVLVMVSLFVGDFSHAGWVGLTPLTELANSPTVGVDYWLWLIQISSIGTTVGAVNIIATILKMRAPGMTLMRMPIFSWTALATNIVGLTSFPVLTVALFLLTLDRYIGTHFFTADGGGNFMMYTNLFWIWGHPEVYFVVLPAFGMISEIVPTFSQKPLFNHKAMIVATMAIAGVAWSVWLHHFFIMGSGPVVNSFFSISTMLVGIPTGVKVFNWAFTMVRGRVRLETPMLWALAAVLLLIGGGMTGMMVAIPAINYVTHNSVFVVAHFHNMFLIIAFALFGAVTFWWPKAFGFRLDERLGRIFFWLFWGGSVFVFVPMYALGFLGMTRRLAYISHPSWWPLLLLEVVGIGLYIASLAAFVLQLVVSIRDREKNRVRGPDAWGTSRSLEWATHCPPPFYNFAATPVVHSYDEWAWRRERNLVSLVPDYYADIHMPKNSMVPLVLAFFVGVFGFAAVWRIWWLAGLALVGVIASLIFRMFQKDVDYTVSAEEVERIERAHLAEMADEDTEAAHRSADVASNARPLTQ
ncbi:cbb3-type cytochrome c oxidase subunit I [Salinisphaera sp.]|uniref:cbb3-type cytochrome c oxidase subunit I n=1 Tax=Salinisphaera sp. TaxID=1914330 RepID=UPI002D769F21|nr:cbb3-type cytochrome c oxidase subunit I [Salinisphaera sp.]HET7314030.1 cbb3-type cytochrome c oxidase subunit I [Salinisphaera sp.]